MDQRGGSFVAVPCVPLSSPVVIYHCSLGPVTPGPSLALLTTMGMRSTGDGHPMTGPLHAFGVPEMTEDLRSALERAGTR